MREGFEPRPFSAEEFVVNFDFQFLVFVIKPGELAPVILVSLSVPEHPPEEAADDERAERTSDQGLQGVLGQFITHDYLSLNVGLEAGRLGVTRLALIIPTFPSLKGARLSSPRRKFYHIFGSSQEDEKGTIWGQFFRPLFRAIVLRDIEDDNFCVHLKTDPYSVPF